MARNPFDHTVKLDPIPTKKHHVKIKDWKTGKIVFEQEDVEAPETWSETAVNIATSRWFRGKLGTPERETSTEQMFRRVAREITTAGVSLGHIKADERQDFEDYLVLLQQHQKGVFNTPVYLNAGWTEDPRTSACFLLAVEDNYESLTHHTEVEARVFQHGGGAGVYVGNISHEGRALSKGGYASGPLYFNEGWDRSSGAIKSGGSHRRAARDVTLPIDHPDCYRDKEYLASLPVAALDTDFIREKQIYEKIRKDLATLGHDVSMNSLVDYVLPAQNANRAVLVYDRFLHAVEQDKEWDVICPRTKEVVWTYQARTVWDALCYATWYAADPTIKFFDNINEWNVCEKGRITLKDGTILDLDNMEITTSNPCGAREMRLKTRQGYKEIGGLEEAGQVVEIWDGKAFRPAEFKVTGRRQLCKIVLEDGRTLRFTPDHVFFAYDIHSEFVYEEQVEVKNLLGWYLYDEEKNVVDEVDSALVQVVGLELCVGTELVYDFTMLEGDPYAICEGFKVHNCNEVIYPVPLVSEALISCNLAMLRLTKYFDTKTQKFDVDAYIADVRVLLTCQDILVDYASYPTEIGTEWTRANRILGLSISDLGGLLMLRGLPYDSDEGRNFAEMIAALHFFAAYNHSTCMANNLGPCENYERNKDRVRKVFDKHRGAFNHVAPDPTEDAYLVDAVDVLAANTSLNLDACGLRNMQVVSYAPQGTTGMITDCHATGPEPLIAIQSFKTLSGGGTVVQAPAVVAEAMEAMGLDPESHYKELVETGTLKDYPESVVKVFETALGISVGNEVKLHIHPNGHVDMIAAVQPFVSGAISKCVVGDTLILSERGIIEIADLYQNENDDEYRSESILLADRYGVAETSQFYYGGERETLCITLRDGREIEGTPNHRVLCMVEGGHLGWKHLSEIEVGDYVAGRFGANLWSSEDAKLPQVEDDENKNTRKVYLPEKMSKDLALFLGMITADGSIVDKTYTIAFTKNNPEMQQKYAKLVEDLFGITPRIVPQGTKAGGVIFSSKQVWRLLTQMDMKRGAANKKIPRYVLTSTKETIVSFFAGLSLDAFVTPRKFAICLASKRLLQQVQAILFNAGVLCAITEKQGCATNSADPKMRTYYELSVSQSSILEFCKQFHLIDNHKIDRLQDLLSREQKQASTSTADVIPFVRERLFSSIRQQGGLSRSRVYGILHDSRTKHISRATVPLVLDVLKDATLQEILDCGLFFVPVRARHTSKAKVYDFCVPSSESFVGNGVVNHNTANVPNSYTPEDIGALYVRAWEKGVKAISIYRDGCKGAQPVSIKKEEKKEDTEQAEVIDSALVHNLQEQIANLKGELSKRSVPIQAHRVKLPDSVCSQRLKLRMAGHELYMHVGLFEDGSIGEVFLTGVQGSFVAGMVDAFATLLSLGLQYGVPFEGLYRKFEAVSFAPQGFVAGLGFCASIPALVVKSLKVGIDTGAYKRYADAFYGKSHSEVLPVVESAPVEAGSDVSEEEEHDHTVTGEPCPNCGSLLVQTGKCKTCVSCGYNSGACG